MEVFVSIINYDRSFNLCIYLKTVKTMSVIHHNTSNMQYVYISLIILFTNIKKWSNKYPKNFNFTEDKQVILYLEFVLTYYFKIL